MLSTKIIQEVADTLFANTAIKALWLCGSYGRGDSDEYSDFDFCAYIDDKEDFDSVFQNVQKVFGEKETIIFSKILTHSKTINLIDADWNRIDITLMKKNQLESVFPEQVKFIFDRDNIQATLQNNAPVPPHKETEATEIKAITNEFIRILGLLPIVIHRNELVVAQMGAGLLRDLLIKIMQKENNTGVIRGALSLKKSLSQDQYEALENAPVLTTNKDTIIENHKYLAQLFFPRAQKLFQQYDIEWLEIFYNGTKNNLLKKLGMEL
jgi:predicted nucleotidyltransferase